ncbi:TerB family tellurite resistance protein [Clostridium nigeriense]|uniref:TerB family tellurite resistance protein n=1 Tax=Clostridium nigeriense TaxID=1805470 RepID=UPI000833E895|nr:TerB family tellurite resistance protein [Clostridium nigeriense]
MFLNELNKDEAMCFLNLVSTFAKVDNKFAEEEKRLLADYKEELGITDEEMKFIEFNDIISLLKKSSYRARSIIYFELVGVALVDGEYEVEEIDFLEKVSSEFDVSRSKKIAIANYFYNFTDVYKFATVDAENNIELLREQAESILN